jgi:hypothetical protein
MIILYYKWIKILLGYLKNIHISIYPYIHLYNYQNIDPILNIFRTVNIN